MLDATPLMRVYAAWRRRRLASQDPRETQRRTLMRLVAAARDTSFGRDHDFAAIRSVADFQAKVPLRRYEDLWDLYWRDRFPRLVDCSWPGTVPYFAVTSGTTSGRTKYIPCTREICVSNNRAGRDVLVHHLAARPASRVLGGLNFMLGGSTDLKEEAPGILSGDLSGIAAREVPAWARRRVFPPLELALIADWEEKIDRLARAARGADIRSFSGTPSWMLLFHERVAALDPPLEGGLGAAFPNLELVVHGGIHFAPYRDRFAALLADSHAETREVYAASEGFIAVADRGDGEGMRMMLDTGLFYEFVPVSELGAERPTRHWIGDVETGVEYALILASCAGLFGYVLGDTVRLVDRDVPRLLVTGRTTYTLSAFGEHLIDREIEEAVADAARAAGRTITDFCVGAVFPEGEEALGGHLYIVEFAEGPPPADALARFADTLDRALSAANEDYEAHRSGGYGMRAPEVRAVPPGFFADWMKRRGQLGGQHKVPRIVTDAELFDDVRQAADAAQESKVSE